MAGITHREQLWDRLKQQNQTWDVIVVGGGITGVGILREAARQGLKALLVEQKDFAWGTSSRSSKMVHGGLRYIAQGDIKLTKHSVQERERLLKEAPGLVERMGYFFTIRKGQIPGKLMFNSLLKVYDSLAGVKTADYFDKKDLLARVPGLNENGLKGASYYADAVTDDARLVLRVLQEAIGAGGVAGNYLAVNDLVRNDQGNVTGAVITNVETGEHVNVPANVVINATGAWVDTLREKVTGERTIRPLRGSHLVLDKSKAQVNDALTLFHPKDKRPVFVFPWEGFTIIGTTDLDHSEDLNKEPRISQTEVDYLLEIAQSQFPSAHIGENDIISTWAGVRPVISKDKSKDPSKEKRDHAVWADKGLVSVSGGKLTTFRLIAIDTLNAAKPYLGGANLDPRGDQVIAPATVTAKDLDMSDVQWANRLIGRYGDSAKEMLQGAPEAERTKIEKTQFCSAELRWAARHESVVHLDDLLLRRTRLGSLLKEGGKAIFQELKAICQEELGWDDARWSSEENRYNQLWRESYSIPSNRG